MTLCYTHRNTDPFVRFDKRIVMDSSISWKAKGILSYAFSRHENWKFYKSEMVRHATDGESSLESGIKELEKAGYLHKMPLRDDSTGRVSGWSWHFFEVPVSLEEFKKSYRKGGFPVDGDSPSTGKSPPTKKDSYTEKDFNNAAAAREAQDFEILGNAEAIDLAVAEDQHRYRAPVESSPDLNSKIPLQACSPLPPSAPPPPPQKPKKAPPAKSKAKPKHQDRAEGHLKARDGQSDMPPPSCEVNTPKMPTGGKYERFKDLLPIWRAAASEAGFTDAQTEKLLAEAIKADYDPLPVFDVIRSDTKGKYSNPYGLVTTAIARGEDYSRKPKAAAKKSRKEGPGARRAEAKPIEKPKKSGGILSKHLAKIAEMKKAIEESDKGNKI